MEEWYRATYATAAAYDNHYSTVRTAVSTLLVTVGLGMSGFVLQLKPGTLVASPASCEAAIILSGVIFVLAIVINLHMQRLTKACKRVQVDIERILGELTESGIVPTRAPRFRDDLTAAYHRRHFHFDIFGTCLLMGVLFYVGFLEAWRVRLVPPDLLDAAIAVLPYLALGGVFASVWNCLGTSSASESCKCGQWLALIVLALLLLAGHVWAYWSVALTCAS